MALEFGDLQEPALEIDELQALAFEDDDQLEPDDDLDDLRELAHSAPDTQIPLEDVCDPKYVHRLRRLETMWIKCVLPTRKSDIN